MYTVSSNSIISMLAVIVIYTLISVIAVIVSLIPIIPVQYIPTLVLYTLVLFYFKVIYTTTPGYLAVYNIPMGYSYRIPGISI